MKGLFIPEITTEMFRNGCFESIEALMAEGEIYDIEYEPERKGEWIPCSERLPEVGEDVFISVGRDVWEAHLRGAKEYFLTHKTKTLVAEWEVDAWMPLPKAYEGREE